MDDNVIHFPLKEEEDEDHFRACPNCEGINWNIIINNDDQELGFVCSHCAYFLMFIGADLDEEE